MFAHDSEYYTWVGSARDHLNAHYSAAIVLEIVNPEPNEARPGRLLDSTSFQISTTNESEL
jgi:hypothetical protein